MVKTKAPIKKKTTLYKEKKVAKGVESKLREKPGMGGAGKYKGLAQSDFAGPNGTYPINTLARARNALARAHFSPNEASIKKKVYARYPELKKIKLMREKGKK